MQESTYNLDGLWFLAVESEDFEINCKKLVKGILDVSMHKDDTIGERTLSEL